MSESSIPHGESDVQATFCATLVDQFVADGVRLAFIAPGSRSTPMALAIAARPEIRTTVLIDERSAAFAALGAALASASPALVLCTSGTAATHFHGAVVEADLSGVPLIVLTADRPPELKDVGAPQTIDQTQLFGGAVRWFHDPGVPDPRASRSWRSLARRCVWAAASENPGPVHLNLPFREPLVGIAGTLPQSSASLDLGSQTVANRVDERIITEFAERFVGRRGLIVAGRGCGSRDNVERLAAALGWPVFAEPRSSCTGIPHSVAHFDSVVRAIVDDPEFQPEIVLRLGEPPASKVVAQWITASEAVQLHVSRSARIFDPDHSVTMRVNCETEAFIVSLSSRLADSPTTSSRWLDRWGRASAAAVSAVGDSLSANDAATPVTVARTLASHLRSGGNLVVSSSMPVRNLEWFGGECDQVTVFSNRGANGIDGVVATAIGVAAATGAPTTVLIGDVALVHDMSSVACLASTDLDVTIVVCDNDGGGIFEFLPQAESLDRPVFERLFGTPHGLDLVDVIGSMRVPTRLVGTLGELAAGLDGHGPRAIVVRSSRSNEVSEHRALQASVRDAVQRI